MSVIDEVKQKTDIVEVIGQYAALKKAGRNLTALCPFHSEKHPSFFVYPEQQSWHCFGACNTGGDVFAFVMKKEGLDFGEALKTLAQRVGVVLPSYGKFEEKKEEKEEFFKVNEAAALYYHNLLLNSPAAARAKSHLEKRGFSAKTISDFQLGFSPDSWEALKNYLKEKGHGEEAMIIARLLIKGEDGRTYDRFRGKLMIPIRDIKGRVTGFGARVLDDSLPKYVNSPQSPTFDKSSTLYGIDRAASAIRKQDRAIIMEGYMDVMMAHQCGIGEAVASMGTAITEKQVNILKKLSKTFYLAFDADIAGLEANERGEQVIAAGQEKVLLLSKKSKNDSLALNEAEIKTAEVIGSHTILNIDTRFIRLPENKDPDEIIKEDVNHWNDLVNQAIPLVDFIFEKSAKNLNLTEAMDKSIFVNKLLPIVNAIGDPVRQAHYLQKLAALVKVDTNTIKASLNRLKPPAYRHTGFRQGTTPAGAMRPLVSASREEYLLALLVRFPELKSETEGLSPEYFKSTENREIYNIWKETGNVVLLKERLDPAIQEHLEAIINKSLPAAGNNVQQRCIDCACELKKTYLKNLAARIAETGEVRIEIPEQIKELDARKSKKRNPAYKERVRR